jgi:hypothetical protein
MEKKSQNSQPVDIFSFTATDATVINEGASGIQFFNPHYKDAQNEVYTAQIRILPNINKLHDTIVHRVYYWLPEGSKGFRYDSPITYLKQPAPTKDFNCFCPVSTAYWQFKDSGDARKIIFAKSRLGIQKYYGAIVQIVNDLAHPENNGKIMPFRIPVEVYKLIDAAMNLSEDDIKLKKKAKNIPGIFDGHIITLKVTKKTVEGGAEYRDYASTVIEPDIAPFTIDGQTMANDAAGQKAIMELLTTAFTDYDVRDLFAYKESDDNTKRKVKRLLAGQGFADVYWEHLDVTNDAKVIVPDVPTTNGAAIPQADNAAKPTKPTKPASPVIANDGAAPTQKIDMSQVDDIVNEVTKASQQESNSNQDKEQ